MNTVFKTIAKVIAFLVAFILVVAIPLSLISYNVGRVVFDAPLVKQVTTELVTESDLIPVALEWFSERRAEQRYEEGEAQAWKDEPDIVQLMGKLETDDWQEVQELILPNSILAGWVDISVDGVYDWIDNEDRVPEITLNLAPFADRLDEDQEYGRNAILIAYHELDPCTEEEIADFQARLEAKGTEVLYNLCEFPGTCNKDPHSYGCDQINDYVESLENLAKNVPDEFALTSELAQTEDTAGVGPRAIKNQLRLIRLLMNLAPLVPLVLLLLILLFAVRSLKGLGMWWGIPITLGGLITFIIALLYRPMLTSVLIAGPMSEVPKLIRTSALGGIVYLMSVIFKPMRGQALVALVLGIALIIVMIVAKSEGEESQ